MGKIKDFEVFSGTGGVGKTTLASARAIELSRRGRRVLLITIDPSKRLKEVMGLTDEQTGQNIHAPDPLKAGENLELYVQLMSADTTMKKISEQSSNSPINQNRILSILAKPYGGMNEILSLVELHLNDQSKKFDSIILDTPPGAHFLDFLESANKIKLFFDQGFLDVFAYLDQSTAELSRGRKIVTMVVSRGVKKLLAQLEKVTGAEFIQDFMEAVNAIYSAKTIFMQALKIQEKLKDHSKTDWFLVTSVEQNKIKEALSLHSQAKVFLGDHGHLLINKSLEARLSNWDPSESDPAAENLKKSLLQREKNTKETLKRHFKNIYQFEEILDISPLKHIEKLSKAWQGFGETVEVKQNGKI